MNLKFPESGGLWRAAVPVAGALAVAGVLLTAPVVGQESAYQTLGPPSCTSANCHAKEGNWWRIDAHYRTADIYLEGDPQFNRIARAYGIDPDDASQVNSLCFNCHGTVISGAQNEEVEYGVSCESCHGPGSGYKDPHQKGYQPGVDTGMAALKNLETRAAMCIDCHVVTDQKLLRVHPPGWTSSGKYTRGMKAVSGHWKEFLPEDKDPAPFDAILPNVVVPIPEQQPLSAGGGGTQIPGARPVVERVVVKEVITQGPWQVVGPDAIRPVALDTLPAPPDSLGTVDLLRILRERLIRLYAALDAVYSNP